MTGVQTCALPIYRLPKMLQKEAECCGMDNMEKNTYVKTQLTAALLGLLEEKDLRDISIC